MNRIELLREDAYAYADTARRATRELSPWVGRLARLGYAVRGALYLTIGGLAALAALGAGGATTESKGALRTMHEQPHGKVLIGIMTVGLVGYALWRFVQAIVDPEKEGTDARGVGKRLGHFGAGLIHSGLVVYAVGLLTDGAMGDASEGESPRGWCATFMAWPAGRWLVGAAAAFALGYAVHQLVRAWRADVGRDLDLAAMAPAARKATLTLARAGLAARAVVVAIVGTGLAMAALRVDPSEAKGFDDALRAVQTTPFGWLLLTLVALGLVAYGASQIVNAKYARCSLA